MVWTEEKPTEPGFYFYRHVFVHTIRGVVEVYESSTGLRMRREFGSARKVEKIDGCWEWAGPIEEPEEPDT